MRFAMSSSPHIRCGDNTRRIMLDVLIALLPTLLAGTIFFGLRCLLLAAVSIAAAGLAEALWNKLTRQYQTVEDLSAAVTGLLLALTLPATVPYWMAAVGAVFAVIVVKAAFGGLGQNIFNPALAAPRPAAVAVSRVHDPFRGPWGIRSPGPGLRRRGHSRHAPPQHGDARAAGRPAFGDVPGQHRWVYR